MKKENIFFKMIIHWPVTFYGMITIVLDLALLISALLFPQFNNNPHTLLFAYLFGPFLCPLPWLIQQKIEASFLNEMIIMILVTIVTTFCFDKIFHFFKKSSYFYNNSNSLFLYFVKRWPFTFWFSVAVIIALFCDRSFLCFNMRINDGSTGTLFYHFWSVVCFPIWLVAKVFGFEQIPFASEYKLLLTLVVVLCIDIGLKTVLKIYRIKVS